MAGAALCLFIAADVQAQQVAMNRALATQLRYFQLQVKTGRIRLTSAMSGRKLESTHGGKDHNERLQVVLAGAETTVNYEQTTPEHYLVLDLGPSQMSARRQPRNDSAVVPLSFEQPPEGPLTLELGTDEELQIYHAATLWHLLLAEPELCRDHLVPLIELLRPERKLADTASAAEQWLYRSAQSRQAPDRDTWTQLVLDLGSDRFSRRQAADRRLRELEYEVLPYLVSLDGRQLDAEQRFRIRMILRSLSDKAPEDTPERVAAWLFNDPEAWYWLLRRDDESQRRMAAERLALLLAGPIDFDPAADSETRQAQFETLRARIDQLSGAKGE